MMQTVSRRFITSVMFALGLAALGAHSSAQVLVTDFLGREVSLAGPAVRIVSLMPSHTETLLAVGADDLLLAIDEDSPQPAGRDLPRIGSGFAPNIELIVSLEPDLVLTDAYTGVHAQLEELGVTTFAGTPETLETVLAFNATVGVLTDREEAAARLTARQEAVVADMAERSALLSAPLVFVELDPTPFSAGPGSWIDDLLQVAGGSNVVPAELGAWPMLSAEFVVAADPDLVLLLDAPWGETEESFRSRPGFAEMSGQVIEVDARVADLLSRPGPGLEEALDWLFSVLHPGAAGG